MMLGRLGCQAALRRSRFCVAEARSLVSSFCVAEARSLPAQQKRRPQLSHQAPVMTEQRDTLRPFLGKAIEICIVTKDVQRTMGGLWQLGIGPWRVYKFTPENTTNQSFRVHTHKELAQVCFAEADNLVWELISPLEGPNIFQKFLDEHGEGIHHTAWDCNNVPFEERIAEFQRRGFALAQGGSWMGRNHFAFFETEAVTTTCIETYEFPADWEYPEPERWFPARPG